MKGLIHNMMCTSDHSVHPMLFISKIHWYTSRPPEIDIHAPRLEVLPVSGPIHPYLDSWRYEHSAGVSNELVQQGVVARLDFGEERVYLVPDLTGFFADLTSGG